MTIPLMDRDGLSTTTATEGQAALAAGDTLRARKKYEAAGRLLEARIASTRKQAEKHFFRFLAASQYYLGGHYRRALELCQQVEQRLLPLEVRDKFPTFFHDVKARAADHYQREVRQKLSAAWRRGDHARVLELLQEHPYILPRGAIAFIRAAACEKLKNYRAAAAFYADAVRWNPKDPDLIFTAGSVPLTLQAEGRLDEAWEYVQNQLETMPHVATYANASLVCFHRASVVDGQEQQRRTEEQLRFFDAARKAYKSFPSEQANYPEFLAIMVLAHEAAAFGLRRIGDLKGAIEVCDEAVALGPATANSWTVRPWTVRGVITYPSDRAVADFRKALSLGEKSYAPYYFLTHDALTRGDFQAALPLCEKALMAAAKANPRVQSDLYGWLAVCKEVLGSAREDVEALFRQAREMDPANLQIKHNYRLFREVRKPETAPDGLAWSWGQAHVIDDQLVLDREAILSKAFRTVDGIQHQLQGTRD